MASILASFLLTIVVARVLGLQEAGVFFLVMSATAVAATFGRFGTDNLALKLLGREREGNLSVVGRLMVIATIASLAGAAICIVGAVAFQGLLPGASGWALAAAASAVVPQALSVVCGSVLRARHRLATGTFAELGSYPLLTAMGLGVGVLSGGSSLDWALGSLATGSWITVIWAGLATVRVLRGGPTAPEASSVAAGTFSAFVSRQASQLIPMMGTSLIFYVITWAPVFVLSVTSQFEAVSLYTAAARLVGFITLIPAIQVSYLAPQFARHHQRSELGELNELARRSATTALTLSLLPGLILIVFGGFTLRLVYGAGYEAAAVALALLSLSAIVAAGLGQVNQLMLLCDMERRALVLNVGLLALWISVGWLAAVTFGITGVAAVSAFFSLVYNAVAAGSLLRGAGITAFARLRPNLSR